MTRKIYVASSWHNVEQPELVITLQHAGHEVYDFRHPKPGVGGFLWPEIDKNWSTWTPKQFIQQALLNQIAQKTFIYHKAALDWCDTCVLLLPSGRSAHLEAGYVVGQGKDLFTLLRINKFEPELMYLLGNTCVTSIDELLIVLKA